MRPDLGQREARRGEEADCPLISVVICTRNRVDALRNALAALDRAVKAVDIRAELIVVDNGSGDDETALTVGSFAADASLPVRLIGERMPGLARARNAGLRAVRGRIIAITDDDCQMAEDYFRALTQVYGTTSGPLIVGGRVELGDPDDLPLTIKTDRNAAVFKGIGAGGFILGCNMTLNRAALDILGPMDERFGAGSPLKSAEETDYVYRAWLAGIPVLYAPEICVSHHHGRRDPKVARSLMRDYALGNGALYAKHLITPLPRQFRWDLQAAFQEAFGGPRFMPALDVSYASIVKANLLGAAFYVYGYLRSLRQKRMAPV